MVQQKPCVNGERLDVRPYKSRYGNVSEPGPSKPNFTQPPTPGASEAEGPQPQKAIVVKAVASSASSAGGIVVVREVAPAYTCDNPSPEMRRLRQEAGLRTIDGRQRAEIQRRMNALKECDATPASAAAAPKVKP